MEAGLPRPHKLYIYEKTGEEAVSDKGFPIEADWEWIYKCACRHQPNGSVEFKDENGRSFYYSSTVFVDLGTPKIHSGEKIMVKNTHGDILLTGTVKRFSVDMAHCRIWV